MKSSGMIATGVALVGCLGCGGVFFAGMFGVGLFGIFMPSGAPISPISPPPPSIPPVTEARAIEPSTPSDWQIYRFEGPCPGGDELVLTHFQVAYAPSYTPLDCRDQRPSPWAYVTFHREEEGEMQRQVTLATAFGDVEQSTLAEAANGLAAQLGSATTVHDETFFIARGEDLLRRDAAFVVTEAQGGFTLGTYVIRQVWVPQAGANYGLLVQMLSRVDPALGVGEALASTRDELSSVVESIAFE